MYKNRSLDGSTRGFSKYVTDTMHMYVCVHTTFQLKPSKSKQWELFGSCYPNIFTNWVSHVPSSGHGIDFKVTFSHGDTHTSGVIQYLPRYDLINKHIPLSTATLKGHMVQNRKGLQATSSDRKLGMDARIHVSNTSPVDIYCFAVIGDRNENTIYSDLTGRFPIQS